MKSAKFVEALISYSSFKGFKNSDNIKPGHRNIYINGGETHPYCKPLGWLLKSLCNHFIPLHILTYMNNHANFQCLVNYVCPKTVTADDLAPFHSKNPDEKKVNLNNYFNFQLCLSFCFHPFPCVRKLASIPAIISKCHK